MPDKLDLKHIDRIGQVLGLLADLPPANAILVCEDACVVSMLALRAGISMAQAVKHHEALMAEYRVEFNEPADKRPVS